MDTLEMLEKMKGTVTRAILHPWMAYVHDASSDCTCYGHTPGEAIRATFAAWEIETNRIEQSRAQREADCLRYICADYGTPAQSDVIAEEMRAAG